MPSTVHINESTRTSLRALIVIAAIVVFIVPIAFTVAHGASRLNYGRISMNEEFSADSRDLQFDLDTSARVVVKTTDVEQPQVALTGTGPRGNAPILDIRETGTSSVIAISDDEDFENARIEVFIPASTSKELSMNFDLGFGTVEVAGDFKEVVAKGDGGSIDINGSAERVLTETQWGATDLHGTFGSVESTTDVGTIDGSNLSVRDRVDVSTSAGAISLDFSNEMVPMSGISATTDEGTIDLRLPRLELVQANLANGASANDPAGTGTGAGDAGAGDIVQAPVDKELQYRISSNSTEGTVDLDPGLKKFDASNSTASEDGKTIIPISAGADTGFVTIDQN